MLFSFLFSVWVWVRFPFPFPQIVKKKSTYKRWKRIFCKYRGPLWKFLNEYSGVYFPVSRVLGLFNWATHLFNSLSLYIYIDPWNQSCPQLLYWEDGSAHEMFPLFHLHFLTWRYEYAGSVLVPIFGLWPNRSAICHNSNALLILGPKARFSYFLMGVLDRDGQANKVTCYWNWIEFKFGSFKLLNSGLYISIKRGI